MPSVFLQPVSTLVLTQAFSMNPELIKAARLACQRTVCYRLPSTWGFQIRIAVPGFLSFCNVGSGTQAQILMFTQQAVYQLS